MVDKVVVTVSSDLKGFTVAVGVLSDFAVGDEFSSVVPDILVVGLLVVGECVTTELIAVVGDSNVVAVTGDEPLGSSGVTEFVISVVSVSWSVVILTGWFAIFVAIVWVIEIAGYKMIVCESKSVAGECFTGAESVLLYTLLVVGEVFIK